MRPVQYLRFALLSFCFWLYSSVRPGGIVWSPGFSSGLSLKSHTSDLTSSLYVDAMQLTEASAPSLSPPPSPPPIDPGRVRARSFLL
jgi:hypothetical protein